MKKMIWYLVGGFVVVIGLFVVISMTLMKKVEVAKVSSETADSKEYGTMRGGKVKIERQDIDNIRMMIDQGNLDEGIQRATELVDGEGNTADILGLLGEAYTKKKEYDKALEYFGRALRQYPNNPWFLKSSGFACINIGKEDQAIDYFTKTIAADKTADKGDAAYAYLGLSFVYTMKNNREKAMENVTKALRIQPQNKTFISEMEKLKSPQKQK